MEGILMSMSEIESFQIGFKQNVTDRVKALYDNARDAYPSICVERARYWTESWKSTEGQPIPIRRAKALANVLEKMKIYILDGELIVGNVSSKPRASVVCPEYDTTILYKEFLDNEKAPFVRPYDHHEISEEVKRELMEDIFPYWNEKTIESHVVKALPSDTIRAAIPSLSEVSTIPPGPEIYLRHGPSHLNVNYEKLIRRGALSIIEEVKKRINELNEGEEEKRIFYEAVLIVYDALIKFAERYSELAISLAEKEENITRKNELLEIAKICKKVPAKPAETFHEALQTLWFTQIVLFGLEQDDTAISPGRMDQYLYPYYKADIEAGRLTKDEAQELIELLFIKFAHMSVLWDYTTAKYYAGFSLTQTITIGGVKEDGTDATNELTYMFLEAEKQVGLFQPEFAARINKNSPHEYLMKIADVIRMGHGKPKIFVDETAIQMMLKRGATLEEARNYCIVGCVEPSTSNNQCGWTNATQFNLAKCLELALNSGVCMLTGKQIGVKTQDPMTFKNINEVLEAYRQQVAYFVEQTVKVLNCCIFYHAKLAPNIFTSSLLDGCLESGKDMTEGGSKYKAVGLNGVGVPDVGNSLAALEYFVFRNNKITMKDMLKALRNNFEGEEDLRQMLEKEAPKYGNDDPYVDLFVRKAGQIWCEEVEKHTGPHGEKYFAGLFAVSSNVPYGLNVAALPNGRKAKEPLANGGISAVNGTDHLGPTALIRSASRLDHVKACNGTLLNMRFSPGVLKEERDLAKFANFLRAYALMDGFHVQFNVVSSSLLKKAQKEPQKYRNLMVRVAGYSAYFVELCKEVQDDLINRTVYSEIA
jgi:formate C-acetyltransferase